MVVLVLVAVLVAAAAAPPKGGLGSTSPSLSSGCRRRPPSLSPRTYLYKWLLPPSSICVCRSLSSAGWMGPTLKRI